MATGLATFVAGLEQTWTALADVCTGLTPEQWDAPTDLPGWTVKDNVSHVVGVELLMLGEPYPDHVLPEGLDHIRNDAGRWVEVPVDLRRPVPGDAVLAELRDVTERRLKGLRALDDTALETEVTGIMGRPMLLRHLLGIRVFDCWAHEQDVRHAVGVPGGLEGPAAELSRRRVLLGLSSSSAGAGRSIVVALSGPDSVATLRPGSAYADVDTPDADVRIETDFATFLRLATGRCHWPDCGGVIVSGDTALAEAFLRDIVITP